MMHRRQTEGTGVAFPSPQLNTERALSFGAVGCLLGGDGLVFGALASLSLRALAT